MRDAYYEWLSEVRVDPDHLAEVGAVRFLFGEVILFPPSHTWLLGSKSRQPACRGYLNYSPPSRGHSIYLYYLKCFYMLYCRFSSAYLLTEALIYTVAPPPHPAPPYPQLCFPWSQLPTVNLGLEEDGLPSDTCQKVNSSYTMPHAHIIDLTSFHHGSILSSRIIARRRVSAGPWGILRENATMLAWLSWHPSVTIIVLHLPLCLLSKFNFVVSMQVPENTQCI